MNNFNYRWNVKSKITKWGPHVLLLFWIFFLGGSIWQHALHSVQPPLYDPLGYMQKAMNFWQAVEQGEFFNPFNLDPGSRPPGTILMSYPFGFSPDFHGFHFRSVFLPILSLVGAVYIVAGGTQDRASGWWLAAIAMLFSSLPLFFYFDWVEEINGPTRWGLVDNFQAGIAALAAAATVRSLLTRSAPWLWVGSFLASFTLLIKPSGLMIMALIGVLWIVMNFIEWRYSSPAKSFESLPGFLFKNGFGLLTFYTAVIGLSFSSKYLSEQNFAYAQQALPVMREMLQIPFETMLLLFHQSFGAAVILWACGVGLIFLRLFLKNNGNSGIYSFKMMWLLVLSFFIWVCGAWYWLIVQAGGNQIRYFYPFIVMGMICLVPVALSVWPHIKKTYRGVFVVICLLPAMNIGGLLVAGDSPPIAWQKWSGVSVSVGKDREEVRQAYDFLSELRKINKSARLYSFSNGILADVFVNVGEYERLINPDLAVFRSISPYDWLRGFAVRVEELLECDYVLIRKHVDQESSRFVASKSFDLFDEEITAFELWLFTKDESSGVETVSDGSVLRLLRIIDRRALARAFYHFVSERVWRPEFYLANKNVPWWNADLVAIQKKNPVIEEVRFEDIYMLHALSVNWINSGMSVEVWWEELKHEQANTERYLFLHLVDKDGNIIDNQQVALFPFEPPFENRRWRHGEAIFVSQSLEKGATSVAFGIYHPSGKFLLADKGNTDWDGRRVLIPIN